MRVCIVSLSAASLLACIAALAAEPQGAQQAGTPGPVIRSSDLSGLAVYNPNNERLGKIEDLVIDPAAGKIRYAVLSFGGFLGMGDKYFAVPWKSMTFATKGETKAGTQKESYCVLDVDKNTLKGAPGFDKDHWPDFAESDWQQKVDEYYRTHTAERGQGQTR